MEFRLSYRGPLKANAGSKEKHALRKHFHRQLAILWSQVPLNDYGIWLRKNEVGEETSAHIEISPFVFYPLVSTKHDLIADLDILMLRPEAPGSIVTKGGDLDNCLKTLLDSLKVPDANALPTGATPDPSETLFHCLLEDDKLITGLSVTTDRLLEFSAMQTEVALVIRVVVKASKATWGNLGIL